MKFWQKIFRKKTKAEIEASYFPLKIRYTDNGEEKVVQSSLGLVSGRSFVVLETKVGKNPLVFLE